MRKAAKTITGLAFAAALATTMWASPASSETIAEALALAYNNNPSLNAARAQTRSVDENVAIAKSGLRPNIFGNADYGSEWTKATTPLGTRTTSHLQPGGFGVTISQALFDGFKTRNNVEAARAAVLASRETLRNTEQNVLFDAASAYMDVIRDQAIASFRAQNLEFLNELVRSERTRFDVGESTRTDVAQAEASRAGAQAQLSAARAQLQSSIAVYRQIIGTDPNKLQTPSAITKLVPGQIDRALEVAFGEHPAILATKYLVDQADWNVKSAESDLLPTLSVEGSAQRRYNQNFDGQEIDNASVTARLRVPIYQGGRVSAQVRQNKEVLGQRWIEVDQTVDSVRAAVISSYSQLQAAQASLEANEAQLRAARLALQGSIEERKVGQRTTLDVLRAQQDVINAQLSLANSQRDIIVAGYAALSAVGRLSASQLNLSVVAYNPEEHYVAVKDKWYGLRTPDGR